MTYLLAFFFGMLSLIILYAEIANIFNFKHNLIFDIVTSPDFDVDSPNYFYISNVTRPDVNLIAVLSDSPDLPGVCDELWAVLAEGLEHLCTAQQPPH